MISAEKARELQRQGAANALSKKAAHAPKGEIGIIEAIIKLYAMSDKSYAYVHEISDQTITELKKQGYNVSEAEERSWSSGILNRYKISW